jgi:hypothetical protein
VRADTGERNYSGADEIHSPLFAITAGGEVYRDGRRLSDQPNWREEIKLRIAPPSMVME